MLLKMVDFVKGIYFLVVVVAVGWYSVMMMSELNKQLSTHFISNIRTEVEENPAMKQDYEKFKKEQSEREVQEQPVKELEEEAKRIQEKITRLANKSGKYVKIEADKEDYKDQPNQSRVQVEL